MATHPVPTVPPASRAPALADSALLSRLRETTADAHRTLERHPLLAPLLSEDLRPNDYHRVLSCFLGYYRALERYLSVMPGDFQESEYRYHRRTPLLLRDLRALNATPPPSEATLPVPSLASREHVLGTLYVLEGATQGGRIIGPRVCRQLGLTPQRGAQFFHLFHRAQWPRYRILLERETGRSRATVVEAGALEAFETLHVHMDAQWASGDAP